MVWAVRGEDFLFYDSIPRKFSRIKYHKVFEVSHSTMKKLGYYKEHDHLIHPTFRYQSSIQRTVRLA